MKYRFSINYLNINNISQVEEYLEGKAREGLLLKRIVMGNLFIFEKVEARDLVFTIAPNELETSYNRMAKDEKKEYDELCKISGWNYITSSFNLQIYYRERSELGLDIHTDDDLEFEVLESIGNKQLKSLYISLPLLMLISAGNISALLNTSYRIRSGFSQIIIVPMLIGVVSGLAEIFTLKKFLKTNRKRLELGDDLEFQRGSFNLNKLFLSSLLLSLALSLVYTIYLGIFLNNRIPLIASLPGLIGFSLGGIYRFKVKPRKISLRKKKGILLLTLLLAGLIGFSLIFNLSKVLDGSFRGEREVLRLLDGPYQEETYLGNISFLAPRSYDYSFDTEDARVRLEYSKLIGDRIGHRLVEAYKKEANQDLHRSRNTFIEVYRSGKYSEKVRDLGLEENEFNELLKLHEKEAFAEAIKILDGKFNKEVEVSGFDQVYVFGKEEDKFLIRRAREVYFIEAISFKDMNLLKKALYKIQD